MMFDVNKFARLARVRLTTQESKKIGHDLQDILDHFKELETVDTTDVEPVTGGTSLSSVFRDDETLKRGRLEGGTDQFPETKSGYLKAPKIFE